jgi:hypothetical protein
MARWGTRKTVIKVRSRIDQVKNHAKSEPPSRLPGGLNTHQKHVATGIGAANMKGWRRPQRLEHQRSDIEPTKGSEIASANIAIVGTRPASSTSRPKTWL